MALLSKLVPLALLFIGVAVLGLVMWVAITIANDIAGKTSTRMQQKNVKLGREGIQIGVNEVRNERYIDRTQSILVRAWNYSTWPAYKSRYWNRDTVAGEKAAGAPRKIE